MTCELVCPKCGEEGTISWKYDAWACFEVIGVDSQGSLMKSADFDTQVFDDNKIECSQCGGLFAEREIVELLRRANDSMEE